MSLYSKILWTMVMACVLLSGVFFMIWFPNTERQSRIRVQEEAQRELSIVAQVLVTPLLENDIASVYEDLDTLGANNASWLAFSMVNAEGEHIYPFDKTDLPKGPDIVTLEQEIALSNVSQLGMLTLHLDMAAELAPLRSRNQSVFAFIIAGFVISMALMLLIARRFILQPMGKLTSAASSLAEGQYDTRLPNASRDEIGELVNSFEAMRHAIQEKERSLTKAKDVAEAGNKAKSEFLSAMSHEIRTPMTAVKGFAELLLDDPMSADKRQKVEQIRNASVSLLRILNDVLDMSKLEVGKMQIDRIDFDVLDMLQDITEMFDTSGRIRPDVFLTMTVGPDVPQHIFADPARLRQVLLNLMGNAAKFTHEGTIRLSVTADRPKPGDTDIMLRIEVEDTGIGMSKDVQKNIFASFTQADASISRTYEGTGLGLAIARQLVELMGGAIGVNSEEGKGSRFWFTLPAKKSLHNPKLWCKIEDRKVAYCSRKLNILYAEDNSVNQILVQGLLGKYGHQVDIVKNGREVVNRIAHDGSYDLILMDVRMPVMNGQDATRHIRALDVPWSGLPIIALTADAVTENVAGYYEAGMNAFVEKPIDLPRLLREINSVIDENVHTFEHIPAIAI